VGDPGRLRQILTNLVGNAVKFTREGEVGVAVSLEGKPGARGVRLLFKVRDTGIGIPADMKESIFESFAQVNSTAHRQYGGTGLGLSISKSLVEMMGGRIWAESEVGKGSTFFFTVVAGLAAQPGQPEPEVRSASVAPPGALSILLAEDDAVNRLVAQELLRQRGHLVDVAGNGLQAIEMLKAGNFDLVLMDVRMPDMDGLEAAGAIRRGAAGMDKARVPVVALTAYALEGDRERFLAAGMDDYLSKPIDTRDLDRVLGKVAGRGEAG
jgi:two-component system CheB/CheR fusion protein